MGLSKCGNLPRRKMIWTLDPNWEMEASAALWMSSSAVEGARTQNRILPNQRPHG